ncbi:MAG: hypothetical protein MK110_15150 [Fuerstiella sp.]|nr:hypothetical protein [Fuerstiella sp.]
MTGITDFVLNQVGPVSVLGLSQIDRLFSRNLDNLDFGGARRQQVYDSDGDFHKNGVNVHVTPVQDFKKET